MWIRPEPRRVRLQSLCPGCIVNRKKLVHRGVQNFAFMSFVFRRSCSRRIDPADGNVMTWSDDDFGRMNRAIEANGDFRGNVPYREPKFGKETQWFSNCRI